MGISAADVTAINAVTRTLSQALVDHDADAYLRHCTDEVVFMASGTPNVEGRAASKEFLDGFPTPSSVSHHYDVVDGAGDLAFARGEFTLELEEEGTVVCRAVLIFRRSGADDWKLDVDIWHMD
jgi:ketosteroid isomerase-like protein